MTEYFGHTKDGVEKHGWQKLEDHLTNVSELAGHFCGEFDSQQWGEVAGILHDLGKYSQKFQEYLVKENKFARGPDHSSAGAQFAMNNKIAFAKIIAYVVSGHHSGLLDGNSSHTCLEDRLKKDIPQYCVPDFIKDFCNGLKLPPMEWFKNRERLPFQLFAFVHMLFSSLVDADYLDTEAYMDPERAKARNENAITLENGFAVMENHLQNLRQKADEKPINKIRNTILQMCLDKAECKPGLFSLTVPTGGGKTISSLAFAMKHAKKFNKKRVIYSIPFTSIIEQNAGVFRDIFGGDFVLEHHCNVNVKQQSEVEVDGDDIYDKSRLATENWDAPLIVTTNVQLLESLFSNKTSKCRKLHNIANSVIILDEAQSIPFGLLRPTLEMLRELTVSYGCSIVFCTATQPSISNDNLGAQTILEEEICEITNNTQQLFDDLKRVEIENIDKVNDEELVQKLESYNQVLCIVNTKKHAQKIFQELSSIAEGVFHLSASMIPMHRTEVLNDIKECLELNKSCRVISTQVIEAGVDIDFPIVFRAIAGIDSIAQAAGRCNREGFLGTGKVFVFIPEAKLPAGHFSQSADCAQMVMRKYSDLLSPEAVTEYFDEYIWSKGKAKLDDKNILKDIDMGGGQTIQMPFATIASNYQLIEDVSVSIIIPRDNEQCHKILRDVRAIGLKRYSARALQPYTIGLRINEASKLLVDGLIEELDGSLWVLNDEKYYSDDFGYKFDTKNENCGTGFLYC